jgi:hypothetical protein
VSTGSLPYRAAVDAAVAVAAAVCDVGELPAATAYPEAQARLARYADFLARWWLPLPMVVAGLTGLMIVYGSCIPLSRCTMPIVEVTWGVL